MNIERLEKFAPVDKQAARELFTVLMRRGEVMRACKVAGHSGLEPIADILHRDHLATLPSSVDDDTLCFVIASLTVDHCVPFDPTDRYAALVARGVLALVTGHALVVAMWDDNWLIHTAEWLKALAEGLIGDDFRTRWCAWKRPVTERDLREARRRKSYTWTGGMVEDKRREGTLAAYLRSAVHLARSCQYDRAFASRPLTALNAQGRAVHPSKVSGRLLWTYPSSEWPVWVHNEPLDRLAATGWVEKST